MKHALAVAILVLAVSNEAVAQGCDIHTRFGGSGSHFTVSSGQQLFQYEATVSGTTTPFEVRLEVFHNTTLKYSDQKQVTTPVTPYFYSTGVGMGTWGLSSGDTVTFVLKVINLATGATMATHILHGDVAGT